MISINNKKTCVCQFQLQERLDPFSLKPGNNIVTEEKLSELKKHPRFMSKVDLGWFEIIEEKKFEEISHSVNDMKKFIADLYDVEALETIAATDKRRDVKKAAQVQIDLIKARPDKENDLNKDPYAEV